MRATKIAVITVVAGLVLFAGARVGAIAFATEKQDCEGLNGVARTACERRLARKVCSEKHLQFHRSKNLNHRLWHHDHKDESVAVHRDVHDEANRLHRAFHQTWNLAECLSGTSTRTKFGTGSIRSRVEIRTSSGSSVEHRITESVTHTETNTGNGGTSTVHINANTSATVKNSIRIRQD